VVVEATASGTGAWAGAPEAGGDERPMVTSVEFLNVSHQTLYELMKEGLPSHKIGRKRVFLKEDLIRWIKEH
jgi:excisionase family DNA binding protein